MDTHPQSKHRRKMQSSSTKDTKSKDAGCSGCSVQMLDEAPTQLQSAFQWNSKFFAAMKDDHSIPDSGGIIGSDRHCHVFGHYEFAGGGGAEVAAAAVAAKLPGVTVDVVSQADWDKGKLKALNSNMPASCKFRDIMNTVDSPDIKNLPEVEVVLTQEQILASLGYSRCRIPEDVSPPRSSASSFSEKSSESTESESENKSNSDHTSRARECRNRTPDSTHRTDGDGDSDGSLADSTDESVVSQPNDTICLTEDDVSKKLHARFTKKHILKHSLGLAEEGWCLCSSRVQPGSETVLHC